MRYVSRDLNLWVYQRGVTLDFSRSGKSTNGDVVEWLSRFKRRPLLPVFTEKGI